MSSFQRIGAETNRQSNRISRTFDRIIKTHSRMLGKTGSRAVLLVVVKTITGSEVAVRSNCLAISMSGCDLPFSQS